MPKLKPGTIVPTAAEDAAISAAAMSDPDARPLTDTEWLAAKRSVRIGRPKAVTTKERITIRLSPNVVDQFRATGPGWQTRMDAALSDWLKHHSPQDLAA